MKSCGPIIICGSSNETGNRTRKIPLIVGSPPNLIRRLKSAASGEIPPKLIAVPTLIERELHDYNINIFERESRSIAGNERTERGLTVLFSGERIPILVQRDHMSELEREFDERMMDIYRRARSEAKYNAVRYLQMLTDHRGLETARILLHAGTVSDGYTALWERKRLDITVEALIFDNPKFQELFTPSEVEIAKKRLIQYQYPAALGAR